MLLNFLPLTSEFLTLSFLFSSKPTGSVADCFSHAPCEIEFLPNNSIFS